MALRTLISRADLDAGRVDFSDTGSDGQLRPVHPGEVLRHDFLEPPNRITAILAGVRGVAAPTALRLARHFDTSAYALLAR